VSFDWAWDGCMPSTAMNKAAAMPPTASLPDAQECESGLGVVDANIFNVSPI
jgi:hypothetical protein